MNLTTVSGIRQAQTRLDADVYLYAKNLDTGATITWREDERVRTASTIKLPILAALYDKVAKGEVRWDETLLLNTADTTWAGFPPSSVVCALVTI